MYYLVALLLKLCSLNGATRAAYRRLGNLRNSRKRGPIARKYIERTPGFLAMLERHGILRPGLRVFELGTGWVHWEALMVRSRVPSASTVYDVWDNRSFELFRNHVRQLLDPATRTRLGLDATAGTETLREVLAAPSLEEAYRVLGFSYVVDGTGRLAGIPDESFDLVISSDVGEHLRRADAGEIVRRTFEVLRPGGWAYHQIVLADHLRIYARSAHPKQYLRHGRETFLTWVNNRVQYVNLLQIPEWLALFAAAGFEVVETERTGTCDLAALDVHADWAGVPRQDLACTVVQFLLRRPGAPEAAEVPSGALAGAPPAGNALLAGGPSR
jgi:hypothetical protein